MFWQYPIFVSFHDTFHHRASKFATTFLLEVKTVLSKLRQPIQKTKNNRNEENNNKNTLRQQWVLFTFLAQLYFIYKKM